MSPLFASLLFALHPTSMAEPQIELVRYNRTHIGLNVTLLRVLALPP